MNRSKIKIIQFSKIVFLLILLSANLSLAANSIAVQGRLLNADGTAVTSSSVQFTVKVKSPGAEDCLLYQETQTLNLSQTAGTFALTLGSGTRVAATVDGGNPLNSVFSNSAAIPLSTAPSACANAATSFTPGTLDTRNLEITFNDGSGLDSIPTIPLAWTPQSLYSQDAGKLAGVNGSQYLKVATGTLPTTLSAGDYSNLTALLNGSSTQYMSASVTAGTVVPNLGTAPLTPSSGQMWFDSVSNTMKYYNGTATQTIGTSTGLSSVGLAMPSIFSVAGSPLTANGSVTATLVTQTANTVLAGPSSGGAAVPAFRALTTTDLPVATAGGIIKDGGNSLGAAMTLGTNDANTLGLKTNNSTRMTIDSSGNIGVGTNAPTGKFVVDGASAAGSNVLFQNLGSQAGSIQFAGTGSTGSVVVFNTNSTIKNNGGANEILAFNAADSSNTFGTISFATNGTQKMGITAAGNVGVGTASPQNKLDISSASGSGIRLSNSTSPLDYYSTLSTVDLGGGFHPVELQLKAYNGYGGVAPGYASSMSFWTGSGTGAGTLRQNMTIADSGNVGIGTTTPSALLELNGNDVAANSGGMLKIKQTDIGAAGKGAAIGFYNNIDVTTANAGINLGAEIGARKENGGSYNSRTYLYFNTAGAGGPERMRIDSNGNVGIGTTAPQGKFEVKSDTASADNVVVFRSSTQDSATSNSDLQFANGGGSYGGIKMSNPYSNVTNLEFSTWNGSSRTARLGIYGTAGNVGIGTTNPTALLSVGNYFSVTNTGGVNGVAISLLKAAGSAQITQVYRPDLNYIGMMADHQLVWRSVDSSGSNSFYSSGSVDSGISRLAAAKVAIGNGTQGDSSGTLVAGNVGIGTTAPSYKMTATNGSSFTHLQLDNNQTFSGRWGTDERVGLSNNATGTWGAVAGDGTGGIRMGQTGSYGYISGTSTGSHLLLNATSGNVGIGTTGPSYKLDVAGDINTSTCFRIGATTVSGTCTSDSRLKDNVQDYTAGLSDLLNIRLRTYTFNGLGEMPKTGEVAVGVIAQEVEKTNPELVKTRMVKMQPDDSEKTEIKAVDYSKFSFMLINAVKELYQKWFYDHSDLQNLKMENQDLKVQLRSLASEKENIKSENNRIKSYLCKKDPNAPFCE